MHAFFVSLAVIFVAELGDKSQLMALAFSARYKALPVLIGITVATATVHAFSVIVGAVLGAKMPTKAIDIVAGLAFFGFAWWTWRGDELDDDEEAKASRGTHSAVMAASVAFFLSELGDKTMLATITLATSGGLVGTWAGSTVGMVAADALAIGVGKQLGARLPEKAIRIGATLAFIGFGIALVIEGLRA